METKLPTTISRFINTMSPRAASVCSTFLAKASTFLSRKKLAREILEEFVNNGIGYIAGLMTYNYLSRYIEVRSARNLWGLANFKKKTLVSPETFEVLSVVISAVVGFLILKLVTHFSKKLWKKLETR